MRVSFLALLLLLFGATALESQACRSGPLPPVLSLFPNEIDGMARQLYSVNGGCYTNIYRPARSEPGSGVPWAVVMIEEHNDPFLGDDPVTLADHYKRAGLETQDVDGWPVAYEGTSDLGYRFVTLRDRLRVTVLVKEGVDLASSRMLTHRVLAAILPSILLPCT
jgi:hypothetical protein